MCFWASSKQLTLGFSKDFLISSLMRWSTLIWRGKSDRRCRHSFIPVQSWTFWAFSAKIQVLLCYFPQLKKFEHQHMQARTTLSHKKAIFWPLLDWDEAAVSHTDLSAGRRLDELLINAPGFVLQLVCGAGPVGLTRQPELYVFIAELRSQEVLEGF